LEQWFQQKAEEERGYLEQLQEHQAEDKSVEHRQVRNWLAFQSFHWCWWAGKLTWWQIRDEGQALGYEHPVFFPLLVQDSVDLRARKSQLRGKEWPLMQWPLLAEVPAGYKMPASALGWWKRASEAQPRKHVQPQLAQHFAVSWTKCQKEKSREELKKATWSAPCLTRSQKTTPKRLADDDTTK
jgi:hypothetical protein